MGVKLEEPLNIRGQEVEVEVASNGTFYATLLGKRFAEITLDALSERLLTASRKQAIKIAIEVERETGSRRDGNPGATTLATITGIHQGTGNLLVRWELPNGGTKTEQDTYTGIGSPWMRRLTTEERAELRQLRTEQMLWDRRMTAFMDKVKVDANALAKAAIEKALTNNGEGK